MKINFFILAVISILFLSACSSAPKKNGVSISTATAGLLKNNNISFPLYLTDKIEDRQEIAIQTSADVFIVHTGHILKPNLSKAQNEETLNSLKDKGIDLVNLTLEDFIIAEKQGIDFEKYPQKFLNSSVVDLNEDNIISKPNITSYVIREGVALIGLSDKNLDKSLALEKFLVSDYVLAVLRARKLALNDKSMGASPERVLSSFIIIHTIGADITDVMERLPPNFINSLAD